MFKNGFKRFKSGEKSKRSFTENYEYIYLEKVKKPY